MTAPFLDPDAAALLDTPVVVVDLDRADARIAEMAAVMHKRGVALRPHAKTHKSLQFAKRQVAAGAAGLTVATIGEAEVFADGGFDDLFIAYPVMAFGPKAARLVRLSARCSLAVGVDSVVGVDALAGAFKGHVAAAPAVLVEVDVGGARTGAAPGAAGALARHAVDLGLRVGGVFTHGGHGYGGRAERTAAADDEVTGLTAAAASLRASGLDPVVVSAGSTPTAALSARGAITEERPGTYIFGDRIQAFLAGQDLDDTSLLVAATVVSHGSGGGFVVDAGAKILARDVAPFLVGHGSVLGYPKAVITRVNDHHGVVELPARAPRPRIGSIVWIAPNHVCPVVNLADEYVIAQAGRVVDRWRVDARGRNG